MGGDRASSWERDRKSFRYLGIEREFLKLAPLAQDPILTRFGAGVCHRADAKELNEKPYANQKRGRKALAEIGIAVNGPVR